MPGALLRCMACSGGVGGREWTQNFSAVFYEDELKNNGDNIKIRIGNVRCEDSPRFRHLQIVPLQFAARGQSITKDITIYKQSSLFTPAEVFLIHSSCLQILQEVARLKYCRTIDPSQIFMLCQSLQPDEQRNFGCQKKCNPPDFTNPIDPIIPLSAMTRLNGLELQPCDKHQVSSLLQLPTEVILMIFKFLTPSTLVNLFCVSKAMLRYANLFCSLHPLYFYRCINVSGPEPRKMMVSLFSMRSRLLGYMLDKRWELVSSIACLAEHAVSINHNPIRLCLNTRTPQQAVLHEFGFQELIADIPEALRSVEVHMRMLQGTSYVCGLGLNGETVCTFVGSRSGCVSKVDVSCTRIQKITFIMDSLGIRSLRFGDSQWSSGGPELKCWEGFSIKKQESTVRIVSDALKFRQIHWLGAILFEESISMRCEHASKFGIISQDAFVQSDPEEEAELVTGFGSFTAEAVYLEQDLRCITMYCDNAFTGIVGLCLHTSSGTHQIGRGDAMPKCFPLNGPSEVVSEIDVRLCSLRFPLAIIVRTNWNRQCIFGTTQVPGAQYSSKTLRPPAGHYISCFYFRMSTLCIESFGAIYMDGSRGTDCPNRQPILRMPVLGLPYEEESAHFFESCARLSGVGKIRFYSEAGRCTGLQLFSFFGSSELGRIQETYSHELILPHGEIIRWIRVVLRDEQLKHIEFITANKEFTNLEEGELINVDEHAVIVWWYSKTRDVIRIL